MVPRIFVGASRFVADEFGQSDISKSVVSKGRVLDRAARETWHHVDSGKSYEQFLWDLPFLAFAMAHGELYHCHACAYDGKRKKLTTFLSNKETFNEMCCFCEDVPLHEHEPWGYDHKLQCFNTSKEAEYPVKMCEQYADISRSFDPIVFILRAPDADCQLLRLVEDPTHKLYLNFLRC